MSHQQHNTALSTSSPSVQVTPEAVSDHSTRARSISNDGQCASDLCPPPALHAQYTDSPSSRTSSFPRSILSSRARARVPSTVSFCERVSTVELERGRNRGLESTASSRCGSMDTRMSTSLWNSVFAALHPFSNSAETMASRDMRPSYSQMSLASTSFVCDPEDAQDPDKQCEKPKVDLPDQEDGERFLRRLSRALMVFGAPAHRVESQLASAAYALCIKMESIHLPGATILSFGHLDGFCRTKLITSSTKVDLGRLHKVHKLYKRVIHREQTAKDAAEDLNTLMDQYPIYGVVTQVLLALICGFILSPMAFKGSILDLLVAGLCCGIICLIHAWATKRNPLFGNIVEIISAIFVSFVGRGLSSIPSGIFCYSAIVSANVVKLFPKYAIICGVLELASKQITTGAVKMIYAIIWTLFLCFSIALGSDFYLVIDASALQRRLAATQYMVDGVTLEGTFTVDSTTIFNHFTFSNATVPKANPLYSPNGCYRDPSWPWYLQEPPWWTLIFLVPLYSVFSALAAYQPIRNRELPVMVFVSCCSFAANRGVRLLLPDRADLAGTLGAFVIGTMSHLYSRFFHGTAFNVMFNGIGFLIPSAVAATGGLAQNYRAVVADHYTAGLSLTMRVIQVALGATVGLYMSSLMVYSFGRRKTGALWSF